MCFLSDVLKIKLKYFLKATLQIYVCSKSENCISFLPSSWEQNLSSLSRFQADSQTSSQLSCSQINLRLLNVMVEEVLKESKDHEENFGFLIRSTQKRNENCFALCFIKINSVQIRKVTIKC